MHVMQPISCYDKMDVLAYTIVALIVGKFKHADRCRNIALVPLPSTFQLYLKLDVVTQRLPFCQVIRIP